jgi:hypothetical protein
MRRRSRSLLLLILLFPSYSWAQAPKKDVSSCPHPNSIRDHLIAYGSRDSRGRQWVNDGFPVTIQLDFMVADPQDVRKQWNHREPVRFPGSKATTRQEERCVVLRGTFSEDGYDYNGITTSYQCIPGMPKPPPREETPPEVPAPPAVAKVVPAPEKSREPEKSFAPEKVRAPQTRTTYTLQGNVLDIVSKQPIPNAELTIEFSGKRWSTRSDPTGRYLLADLPIETPEMRILPGRPEYADRSQPLPIEAAKASPVVEQNVDLLPKQYAERQIVIVLTWNHTQLQDLDSILTNGENTVYFKNKSDFGATLDKDDRSLRQGRETTVLPVSGPAGGAPLYFAVSQYDYQTGQTLAEVGARVEIFADGIPVADVTAPPGRHRFWAVARIDGNQVTVRNELLSNTLDFCMAIGGRDILERDAHAILANFARQLPAQERSELTAIFKHYSSRDPDPNRAVRPTLHEFFESRPAERADFEQLWTESNCVLTKW